jgi:hypothetical protein
VHDRDVTSQIVAREPGPLPGHRPGRPQPGQAGVVNALQDPPGGRGRGHRTEQARLVAQHAQVADRLTAIGQQDRQIGEHPARIMSRPALPPTTHGISECPVQAGHRSQIGKQPRAGMRGDTPPVSSDSDLRPDRCSLHLRSASPAW